VRIRSRAPGKVVVLGEYAVLDGAPALVLAVDRYATATLEPSDDDDDCRLRTLMPEPSERRFANGRPSGVPLVDLVAEKSAPVRAWSGTLDSAPLHDGTTKLGLGSSAAALCAWAGAWAAYSRSAGLACPDPSLEGLIRLHREFQGGWGSGIDVAASVCGGVVEFRLEPSGMPRVGSVRLPNSVGFAGIFAGRSASTPGLVAHYRAWTETHPAEAAAMSRRLGAAAEAGCTAARGNAARAFVEAIADYGRGLLDLGIAIGADIVTAEHREIGEHARRHGVAYKVSGAGGSTAFTGFPGAIHVPGLSQLLSGNTAQINAWLARVTATDTCSANATVTNDYKGLTAGCGRTGSANVTFTATDACGNQSTAATNTNDTQVRRILLGDSVELLKKFPERVDFFLHDSDHRPEYEWAEFVAIEPRLHPGSIVMSDNSQQTSKLLEFSKRIGRSFLYFQDQPLNHWWPGDGIGAAFLPGQRCYFPDEK